MNRRKKAIANLNSSIFENWQARKDFHSRWKRGYALVDYEGNIREVKATKKGAESRKESLVNNTYINDMTGEMTDCGSHLEIVEIESDDILELDDEQLWYNTLQRKGRELRGMSFPVEQFRNLIEELEIRNREIVDMVENNWEEIQSGRIFIKDVYRDSWEHIQDILNIY